MVATGDGTKPLVTRAGLQREARNSGQQAVERQGIVVAQHIESFLLNLRQQIVQLDQPLSVAGQHGAAAAFTAGSPVHQRLFAELVHLIDGVPCAFIANARVFRALANRTGGIDLF